VRSARERRVRASRDRGCVCAHRGESECTRRDRFPPQPDRLELRLVHSVSDECVRRLAEQDLPRLGTLLEPRGDVHRVARRESLGGPGHDHARADTDARADTERGQRVAHLDRRAAGTKCIVLVRSGDAEHGHHCVADELLHRPAVRVGDPLHPFEVARQQRTQGLWIRLFPECRRTRHIAEEDGDGLPQLTIRHRGRQRSATEAAELESIRILLAADRTEDRHVASLTGRRSVGNKPAIGLAARRDAVIARESAPVSAAGAGPRSR